MLERRTIAISPASTRSPPRADSRSVFAASDREHQSAVAVAGAGGEVCWGFVFLF
jgi:hypothetical protein